MPHYFFNVTYNGEPGLPDAEGIDLLDDDAAWAQATGACGQMIRDLDGALRSESEWRMEVANADGDVLFKLQFRAQRLAGTS